MSVSSRDSLSRKVLSGLTFHASYEERAFAAVALGELVGRLDVAETALEEIARPDDLVNENPDAFGLYAYRRCVGQAASALGRKP